MAKPTDKISADYLPNVILKGEGCDDLPTVYDEGTNTFISCWELTEEEKVEVAKTGKVFLGVVGTHPPVWVAGREQDVFVTKDKGGAN